MKKINQHIEIVRSTTSGLSSMGSKSASSIFDVLCNHYASVSISIVNNLDDLEALVARHPDLVFLGMKFIPTNPALGFHDPVKIWITEYLDQHNIPYTGSAQAAHELELNKPLAKQCILDAGLNTAPFYVAKQNASLHKADIDISFPIFIKPTNRGGGKGIDSDSVAYTFEQIRAKVKAIAGSMQSDSLIEEYLPGREFSVAILEDEYSKEFLAMPIELIAPVDGKGSRILSGIIKTADTELSIEVKDSIIRSQVSELAIDVFQALGARDYGRIDIRLGKDGIPYFLEANLVPSLKRSNGNYFPKACALNIGMDYEQMILSIVNLAFVRTSKLTIDGIGLDSFPTLVPEPLAA